MTYCLAIAVDEGLLFASDSRTHAGVDQVATYGKMHTFGRDGERQFVLLSSGNLATTQAVLARLKENIRNAAEPNLMTVDGVGPAAEHVGAIMREQTEKHGEALARAGFSAEASFIIGGQVGPRSPKLYLVYAAGNYISTSAETPFLQIGETKYGKPVLDRFVTPRTTLDEAVRCALVSIDSTVRSNATVGPPIEILSLPRDRLRLDLYRRLAADDPYLLELGRTWSEKLREGFNQLPPIDWGNREG